MLEVGPLLDPGLDFAQLGFSAIPAQLVIDAQGAAVDATEHPAATPLVLGDIFGANDLNHPFSHPEMHDYPACTL